MKIVIVGTAYPYRGGLAAFNERLAQQFVAEGHDVTVCTFTLQYPKFLFPGKTQYSTEADHSGLRIERHLSSVNPLSWRRTARAINRMQPQVVVFAYWMSFMAPCMAGVARHLQPQIRRVALVHNMLPHEPSVLDKVLPPLFVRQMQGFVALSAAVVEDIARLDASGKPKRWAPHPIYDHYGSLLDKSHAKALLHLDEETRYVLFFGFIRPYKGLDLLLQAFGDERLRGLKVALLVAGEFYGSDEPYRKIIADKQIGERVVLHTDFIADSEVNRYFSACDLVAQPYKSATQSGVTQIAFHFQKPMLVTRVGGLPEIVPDGKIGYVVEPTPTAIADALVRYFAEGKEPAFTAAMAEEKKKYSWDRMTATLLQTVNDIDPIS